MPVTVTAVTPKPGGLYAVSVAFVDGTVGQFLVPTTMATVQAVTISAIAMATLSDIAQASATKHGPSHRRFTPRA